MTREQKQKVIDYMQQVRKHYGWNLLSKEEIEELWQDEVYLKSMQWFMEHPTPPSQK